MSLPELLSTAVSAARAGGDVLLPLFGSAGLDVRQKAKNDFVSQADHASESAVIRVIRERFPDHAILAEEGGGLDPDGVASRERRDGERIEWIIDPLDGTTNFLQGLPVFAVSVACRQGDDLLAGAILDPVGDRLFAAARGAGATLNDEPIRVSGRQSLEGAFLATGYPFKAHQALDHYLAAFRDVFLEVKAIRRCGAAALDLAHTACGVFDGFFEFRLSAWDVAAGALLIEEAGGVVSDLDGGRKFLDNGNLVAGSAGVQRQLRSLVARHANEELLMRLTGDSESESSVDRPVVRSEADLPSTSVVRA